MTSNKFNAAQKHFAQLELKHRKRINQLEFEKEVLQSSFDLLREEYRELKISHDKLQGQFEKLQKYAKLSKVELDRALKHDETISVLSSLFEHLCV